MPRSRSALLQTMLSGLIDETFNSITVDSDTSTSDTLLLAATGQAGAADRGSAPGTGRAFTAGCAR